MSNFWGAINAIRREATKLRTDLYSAGCFTAQEAAMDLDRAASVLEAAGAWVANIRKAEERGRRGDCEATEALQEQVMVSLRAALPDEVKK